MVSPARSPVLLLAVVGSVLAAGGDPLAADARSTEVLRYECSNQLGRRDVTLFANGTVRLRQGLWEEQELYLDELLNEERVCDIILPRVQKRHILEETEQLEPRVS